MLGFTLGFDTAEREGLAFASLFATLVLLAIAAWRHTPDGLARQAAIGAIAAAAVLVNFAMTLAGNGGFDFERIARVVSEAVGGSVNERPGTGQARAARSATGTMQGPNRADADVADAREGSAGTSGGDVQDDGGVIGRALRSLVGLAQASSARKAAAIFRDCPACPQMSVIPEGYVELGAARLSATSTDSAGLLARVGRRFAISVAEIRVSEWSAFAVATGRAMPRCVDGNKRALAGDSAVVCITQADALAYVAWLSKITGRRYRLPSEAEWERAARAGSARRFWSGALPPQAVAGVAATNPFGLLGLHDRIGERITDCWREPLSPDIADGSALMMPGCKVGVVKDFDERGARAVSAARHGVGHDVRHHHIGVRVARQVE